MKNGSPQIIFGELLRIFNMFRHFILAFSIMSSVSIVSLRWWRFTVILQLDTFHAVYFVKRLMRAVFDIVQVYYTNLKIEKTLSRSRHMTQS